MRKDTEKIKDFVVKIMLYNLYFPGLVPSDLYLFPEVNKELRGLKFVSNIELSNAVMGILN